MLLALIEKFGKDKINTFTKYPSISTLHKMGDRGCLTDELTTPIENEALYATEKIDGTNVRIICYGTDFLIGAREFILHYCDDLYFDNAQGIVQGIYDMAIHNLIPDTDELTVIYGEFYGGKTSSNSKQYGKERNGFRVFDIAVYDSLQILNNQIHEISQWRETNTDDGIIYGQRFIDRHELERDYGQFELVPKVDFELGDLSHETILDNLNKFIPQTNVALTETALKKPEGVVLRNENRTKIVKVRFEDYERTLRKKINNDR